MSFFFRLRYCLIFLILLSLTNTVFAGSFSVKPYANENSSWFVYENVSPGTTLNGQVEVLNLSDTSRIIILSSVDAEILSDGGFAPKLDGDQKKHIGNWLKLAKKEFVIPPKSSIVTNFVLIVPRHLLTEKYFGAIVAESKKETSSGFNISGRVAIRVYLSVAENNTTSSANIRAGEMKENSKEALKDGNIIKNEVASGEVVQKKSPFKKDALRDDPPVDEIEGVKDEKAPLIEDEIKRISLTSSVFKIEKYTNRKEVVFGLLSLLIIALFLLIFMPNRYRL